MKKIFKKLAGLMMGLLVIGGLAGIGAGSNEAPVKAEAATMTGGEVLYLKPNSNWTQSKARFAIYVYGSGDAWASMETCKHDQTIYKATVPAGNWTNVIFCRMNPGTTANNWDNKWNQTGNLVYDGTLNLCTINDNQWDCETNVSWTLHYDDCGKTIENYKSFYLEPNANWKTNNARFAAYFYNCESSGNAWVSMSLVDGTDDIYTAATPEGTWNCVIFCRMNPNASANNWNNKWNQTCDMPYDGRNNYIKIALDAWDKGGGTWSFYLTPNCEALIEGLEKTNTCAKLGVDETTISGSEAIAKFTSKVEELRALYEGLCADEKKYIETQKIDGVTYFQRLEFLELKAAHLKAANETSVNILSNISSNNNIAIILIIGLLGLATIGGYYYLNKKKYAK